MAREKLLCYNRCVLNMVVVYGCTQEDFGIYMLATVVVDISDEASLLNVICDNCFKVADVSGSHSLCVDNSKNCLSPHERRLTARGRTEWKIKVEG